MIGTLAGWRTYATARGQDDPTSATDEVATEALVRGSDYVTHTYVRRFHSDFDETSDYVEDAAYEAALLELGTPGFFSATYTPGKTKVLTEVKGIKWTVRETKSGMDEYVPVSTLIEQMLYGYLRRNIISGFLSTSDASQT